MVEKVPNENAFRASMCLFDTIRPEDIDESLKNEFEKNRKKRFFEEIARRK